MELASLALAEPERDVSAPGTRVVCVGQKVVVDLNKLVFADEISDIIWTIPDIAVRSYDGNLTSSKVFPVDRKSRTIRQQIFYWVNPGSQRHVKAVMKLRDGGTFQYVETFDVVAPTLRFEKPQVGATRVGTTRSETFLQFGIPLRKPGILFRWSITMPGECGGFAKDLQTVRTSRVVEKRLAPGSRETRKLEWLPDSGIRHEQLDGDDVVEAVYNAGTYSVQHGPGEKFDVKSEDSPMSALEPLSVKLTVNDQFRYYVMFRPDSPGSIWVPLAMTEWTWKATASRRGTGWAIAGSPMTPTVHKPWTDFPSYQSNAKSKMWKEI